MTSTWRQRFVQIWYIGTQSQPVEKAIVVYKVIGHNDAITYLQVLPMALPLFFIKFEVMAGAAINTTTAGSRNLKWQVA